MPKKITLKNGMRVHLIPFRGTDSATVLVLCKVGSRYEYEEISGASHFIEHMMFKGTEKQPSTMDISRALDSVGAEFNAYTGKDLTGYYVKVDATHVKMAVDMLHDMLFHSTFKNAEMKRERGVIVEEINMYQDNPMMFAEDLLEQAMFEGNTLGWEIAGTHESVRNMPRSKVIAYRNEYYVPSRMVIAVAGKINGEILKWLEETFGTVKESKEEAKSFTPFGQLPPRKTPRVKLQYKDTQQIQVALGFPSFGVKDKRDKAARLLGIILGGTMSSRLFLSVRERKGLCYFIRAYNSPYEDTGNFMIQAGLDKSRLDLAMKTIFNELHAVRKNGVTAKELKLAKNYIRGKLMLKLEDSAERAEHYARQELFLDKADSPQETLEKYAKVSRSDMRSAAKEILDFSRLCAAGIGPFKTPQSLLKHFPLN